MGVIYKISNSIDDRVYIGSTVNYIKRWKEHRKKLLNNKHQNQHLQNFVNKYGINSLNFSIIENVDDENLLVIEQIYLDSIENKFNIAKNANAPMKNLHHSIDAKIKISKHSSGINNPMYGKKRPQWIVEKLRCCSINRLKSINEKIVRLINLPNRIEIQIKRDDLIYNCFSISHAAMIIGVSQQSISKAIKNKRSSNGWEINIINDVFYKKDVLLNNLNLFDENCHPQPELINMLKSLKK